MALQHQVQSSSPGSRAWFYIGLAAVVAAIGTHGYLTNYHFALKYGAAAADSICNVNATFNCDAAASSRYSELFGVPVALWGALTNLLLLVLGLMYPLTEDNRKAVARTNILLMAGFIAAVSIVMGVISVTALSQYCPFCILTYILSFIAFVGFWLGLPKPSKVDGKYQLADAKGLVVSAAVILFGGFILNSGLRGKDGKQLDQMVKIFLREWQANPQLEITPVSPLIKGNTDPNAKMTIIEFADFRCGHCKTAAAPLDAFVKSHPEARLLFHTWPLDGECNSAIQHSNKTSCALSRAFVCASQKDKGWAAHDWIFARQEKMSGVEAVMSQMTEMSTELGLSWDEIKACMDSEATKTIVREQAELGKRLNIQGTPAIFVNGRQLPNGQMLPVLRGAYDHIMNR